MWSNSMRNVHKIPWIFSKTLLQIILSTYLQWRRVYRNHSAIVILLKLQSVVFVKIMMVQC